ncbi:DUF1127 domain-containing protein [Poseidonocella sedimentorum]|uniref:Uncharacterized conserved protein YjiS, DUF1127 family n=1 Tax=Poseidonocella sedimentorum TaxID=871652 RepID=A0A1I6CQ07_9RHOB|nr:DUF1127 domain-containing protein [Poseidonocella sedimentorum]SFQ95260.1 Uncharacterized conserved protein YjiS, DUF1127 family [Poseidonocella sedimentorum]
MSVRTAPWSLRTDRRASFLSKLRSARSLLRQRRALGRLSAHQLEDIGLTRTQAEREARRPIWDAPDHWS